MYYALLPLIVVWCWIEFKRAIKDSKDGDMFGPTISILVLICFWIGGGEALKHYLPQTTIMAEPYTYQVRGFQPSDKGFLLATDGTLKGGVPSYTLNVKYDNKGWKENGITKTKTYFVTDGAPDQVNTLDIINFVKTSRWCQVLFFSKYKKETDNTIYRLYLKSQPIFMKEN